MFFRLMFDIAFLAMHRDEPVEFTVQRANATIRFEKAKSQNFPEDGWKCIAFCERTPNQALKATFVALQDGSIKPAKDWMAFGLRGLELLGPPTYRAFVDETQAVLAELASQCASVIQWRLGLRGSHQPLQGGRRLSWSFDGSEWNAIMGVGGAEAQDSFSLTSMGERPQNAVLELLEADESEPLGHELLREAEGLCRTGGQRSAFVVAFMAAEVGVKNCIAELAPETEWLLTNIPSPPMMKLLQEQLPLVKAKNDFDGKVLPPPKEMCETLKKAVNMRNDIVHKGRHEKVGERLWEVIETVRDLLYLLDYYRGHKWALDFIRTDHCPSLNEKKS
jgi:hypothetical protein